MKTARARTADDARDCSAWSRSTSPSAAAAPSQDGLPARRRDAAEQPAERQRVRGLHRHRAGRHAADRSHRVRQRSTSTDIKGDVSAQLDQRSACASPTPAGSRRRSRCRATSRSSTPQTDGALDVQSVSGNVDAPQGDRAAHRRRQRQRRVIVQDVQCDRIEAHSVSGNVEFGGTLAKGGRYELNSHSGDVRIVASGGDRVRARSQFVQRLGPLRPAPEASGRSRHGIVRAPPIHGVFGDGSAVLNVTTFSGSVVVTKR